MTFHLGTLTDIQFCGMASNMTLNLPADYYHAQLQFTGVAVPQGAAMTFGGLAPDTDPDDIATAIIAAFDTHLQPVFNSGVTLTGVRVKVGPMEDGPFALVSASLAGTLVTACGPPNNAFLIRKNSTSGGRQGTGRMYQPGVSEVDVDQAGVVLAGMKGNIQTAYEAFRTALVTANMEMYLIHSVGSYQKIVDGAVVTVNVPARMPSRVIGLAVDPKIATQRRRLR
jgi:hypothetical protein